MKDRKLDPLLDEFLSRPGNEPVRQRADVLGLISSPPPPETQRIMKQIASTAAANVPGAMGRKGGTKNRRAERQMIRERGLRIKAETGEYWATVAPKIKTECKGALEEAKRRGLAPDAIERFEWIVKQPDDKICRILERKK